MYNQCLKTMNTNNKGRRNEKKTEAWLQERGFVVQTTARSSYRGRNNDFFGLFDHIAVGNSVVKWITATKNSTMLVSFAVGETLFVQTKSNRKPPKKYIEQIRNFPATHKLIFIWHDRVKEPEILIV